MVRVSTSVVKRRHRKRLFRKVKGYQLDRSKRYVHAKQALKKALVYAYRDRKNKKREFRALWIARINAACREYGTTYSLLMSGLKKAKVLLDRRMLAEIAAQDTKVFKELISLVKGG